MFKKLLCLAVIVLPLPAFAEYIFKYPLEEARGGILPDGSIRYVKAGDGSGLPPTVEPVPPVVVPDTDAELEVSEQQNCLTAGNANDAKAYVEQFSGIVYQSLYYNFTEKCVVQFTATKKKYSNECKATGDNALSRVIEAVHTTQFTPKYTLIGGC